MGEEGVRGNRKGALVPLGCIPQGSALRGAATAQRVSQAEAVRQSWLHLCFLTLGLGSRLGTGGIGVWDRHVVAINQTLQEGHI